MPNRPPRPASHHRSQNKSMSTTQYRERIQSIAAFADEYAGIPMTFKGQEVVIHPSYKFAEVFNQKSLGKPSERGGDPNIRNHWRHPNGYDVYAVNCPDGKVRCAKQPARSKAALMFATMEAGGAWTMEQENRALSKLATLIPRHLYELYMLTGMFPQTSAKSGLSYIFRKLRPTVVLTPHRKGAEMEVLCCLCLHPIGYYKSSWAGVMTPTDEVIAHLLLMRGDEHEFWKQANQHPAHRHESGL